MWLIGKPAGKVSAFSSTTASKPRRWHISRCVPDDVVADFIGWLLRVSQIEVSSSPKSIVLGLKRFVHQASRDGGGGAIKARDHQHPMSRMKPREVGRRVERVA